MIGHLGQKVTALLDGQMSLAEEERAWDHVHACHGCRDAVEREGWVKTQLVQWSSAPEPSSSGLREALLSPSFAVTATAPVASFGAVVPVREPHPSFRARHAVTVGSSALGVAVLGVVALGAAPANAPLPDRRTVTTSVVGSTVVVDPRPTPTSRQPGTVSVRLPAASDKMVP